MSRASFIVVLLTGLALSSHAYAHGGPPAIEHVLASDDQGPWLAELSEGFALRGDDGAWSYVCPALFAADTPPASATIGNVVWFSGAMDLFRLNANHAFAAADEPTLSSARVLALGTIEGALLALRVVPARDESGSAGTELIRVHGDTEELVFQDLAAFWSVMVVRSRGAADEGPMIWLARFAGSGFELLGLSAAGDEMARASTPWPTPPLSLRLSAAGDDVFVHVYDNLGYKLVHAGSATEALSEGAVIGEAQGPMRGPVALGDEVVFTQGERLLVYRDGAAELSDSVLGGEALACLSPPYVCTPSRLYEIDTVDQAGGFEPDEALLDLARLEEPSLRPEDAQLAQHCTAQWLVFQGDLTRAGIASGDGGVPMVQPDAGQDGGEDAGSSDAGKDASDADGASAAERASSGGCSALRRSERHHASHLMSLAVCTAAIYARRRRAQSRDRA